MMEYVNAFLCGGLLCAVGQIILDKTALTPARSSASTATPICDARISVASCSTQPSRG